MKVSRSRPVLLASLLILSLPLCASEPANVEKLAQQLATMQSVSEKGKKASRALRQLHQEFVAFQKAKGRIFKPSDPSLNIHDDRVLIEAISIGDSKALQRILENLGGRNLASSNFLVSGFVPIAAIPGLENIPQLHSISASYPFTKSGLVTSQGDVASRASNARSLYGLDGTGLVIATMSDSFNCNGGAATDVANDDLPVDLTVVREYPGCGTSDEGRAMMQIIHDLAPGSSQMFHTAAEGRAAFANGIRTLANLGADIIVDDIGYPDEPFFQDGPIAQAINEVTSQQGVLYFSAAGNDSDQSYESTFRPDSIYNKYHDFNPGAGEDVFQKIYLSAYASLNILLQWSERYASISGPPGASTDIDICITDEPYTQLLLCAESGNTGGDPIEVLSVNNGAVGSFYNIVIFRYSGTATPVLKYISTRALSEEYATHSSTVYGHPNAGLAIAVGAANFQNTPAYGVSPPLKASYSSKGGTPILFDTAGNPTGPLFRLKPNFTCVDNGNTTFFGQDSGADPDGWPNFTGTSAAAPHAAALTALIKQYKPGLSPQEVYTALTSTAIDMETAGTDYLTGHGLCETAAALGSLEVPDISLSVTPTPSTLPEPGGNVSFGVTVNNVGDIDVTLTALSDNAIGSISGQGNCSVPQNLPAPGGNYSCSYTLVGSGNAGDVLPLTVTATANGPQNSDTENFQTSVTLTDVLPTATLTATADPAGLLEPGGATNILVSVQNTGTAEPINLTSLADAVIGDLNGNGNCAYPVSIQPSATYQCSYPTVIAGNAGDTVMRQVDAVVQDDELNNLNIGDSASVSIADVFPTATLAASVSPSQLNEPGGPATVTVVVTNTSSAEPVTLVSLSASQVLWDLNGQGTCAYPQSINPGAAYQCEFPADFIGAAGEEIVLEITCTVEDDELNAVPNLDQVSVTIIGSDLIFSDGFEGNQ